MMSDGKFSGQISRVSKEQKRGDELAVPATSDATEDDFVVWLDEQDARLQAGDWRVAREGGGGVAGASVVIRALMEVTGKDQAAVKLFLEGKLAPKKPDGTALYTRRAIYDAFRAPGTKTGSVIERMEKEKAAKAPVLDADAELAGIA